MTCTAQCCESPTGRFFSKHSKRYAKQFRKGKLEKAQELLLEGARSAGLEGQTILDIGCGVGVLHLTLLGEGAASAVGVDMSEEMLNHARTFASDRKLDAQTSYLNGDVVALASGIAEADITFMDKVVCCYEHLPDLISVSVGKTRHLLALSHPRDVWYARALFRTQIFISELFRFKFRPWWHNWKRMEAMIELGGMKRVSSSDAGMWRVLIYEKR